MLRGVVDQALADGPRVVPDRAAGASVEREDVICRRDEHDAADDNRSDFEFAGLRNVKDPLSAKLPDIFRSDLIESRVTAAGIIAIVREPIRGDWLREEILRTYID